LKVCVKSRRWSNDEIAICASGRCHVAIPPHRLRFDNPRTVSRRAERPHLPSVRGRDGEGSESGIKEQQRFLFADRTGAATMRANQLRLWFSSMAYALLQGLRPGTEAPPLTETQCDTIRVKLSKIGARIRVTVREVWVALADGCPYEGVFRMVWPNLLATRPTWVPARC
jgi:hypothetical protein